ncbi:hypothetical protein ZEAMMB73_Zm00001d025734 [Zea mays]|uniref:DUF7358 domain-containing protein n=1 Tax=Zea mays TaxID=4577 RepID=A0A1D6J901_MAIZE|nr:hypothetical protein ZEAMMB73_Zm00001d025734 [Zea mays]
MRPTEPARLVGLVRALRRRSVALAAVNLATAAVGVAAEVAGVWMRCETKEWCAVVAVAALTLVKIVAMVGMARAQEVTALAVASDAERGGGGSVGGPSQDFAKRETRVGRHCFSLATFRMRTHNDFRLLSIRNQLLVNLKLGPAINRENKKLQAEPYDTSRKHLKSTMKFNFYANKRNFVGRGPD